MTAPDCTDHGTLILEYVRGNLDDSEGLRAEAVSAECPACRAWLDHQFSGSAFAVVEDTVSQALQTASLPSRRHRFGWMTAAAAVLVIAGGLSIMQGPDHSTPTIVQQQDQVQSTMIGTLDFEGGNAPVVVEEPSRVAEGNEAVETDPLFSDSLEDGGIGAWTLHT